MMCQNDDYVVNKQFLDSMGRETCICSPRPSEWKNMKKRNQKKGKTSEKNQCGRGGQQAQNRVPEENDRTIVEHFKTRKEAGIWSRERE